ncbi:hypothetical protein QFC21_003587 [Naganishia friedmannii]|uniref:Uncharacterized protein n=1 Tax=Naganishia friedmannii TaxID=89922 RepID=A0ACC2VNJ4_9TREE|nr:hypothetical protein QFC21_003587 [Naganishia friedmannii]
MNQQDNSLPVARNYNRYRRSATREKRSGFLFRLSSYSYDYLSPTIAVLGMLGAIALLIYQTGWTVSAISSRIRDGIGQPGLTDGSTATTSQPRLPRAIDATAASIHWPSSPDTTFANKRFKRIIPVEPLVDAIELQQPYQYEALDDTGTMLQPLIPGITVPLSHAFPLLLALLISQVIHEAGHLVAAAMHNILPIRITMGIWAIFPFAAVVLPSSVDRHPPKSLLRIAAAGPYHNLLTYATVLLLPLSGIQNLFYQDVTSQGVYISQVYEASPLKFHLPVGVIVHQLDDVPLGTAFHKAVSAVPPTDIWTAYLLREHEELVDGDIGSQLESWGRNRGWCITEEAWKDSPQPPCPPSTGIRFSRVRESSSGIILSENNDTAIIEHRCFAAYPILTTPTMDCASHCASSKTTTNICLRPLREEHILRIYYTSTGNAIEKQQGDVEPEQVLLYAGDPATVYADVVVESVRPRGGKVVAWAVTWGDVVIMYIATLSLALATLNLLPLPQLDGTHILSALLSLAFGIADHEQGADEYDRMEADDMELDDGMTSLERIRTFPHRDKKRRWHQIITWTTSGLAIACLGGGVILGLL